ncbi:hypothetical protein HA402_013374 [Bradysia odoriphaga]|nr:hypothetical protein HA402_013374 [Bradysia odoriphaga]
MDKNKPGLNHPPGIPAIFVEGPDDSEEEIDREIIEALTRAHPTNAEINPAPIKASTSLAESPKRLKQDSLTEDDMADMEVSHLTSSFESRNGPGPSSVLKKPTASFAPTQPPYTGMTVPRRVPTKKENQVNAPFNHDTFELQIPVFQPLRELSFPNDSASSSDSLSANGLEKRKSRGSSRDSFPSSNGSSPDGCILWRTDGSRIRSAEIEQNPGI